MRRLLDDRRARRRPPVRVALRALAPEARRRLARARRARDGRRAPLRPRQPPRRPGPASCSAPLRDVYAEVDTRRAGRRGRTTTCSWRSSTRSGARSHLWASALAAEPGPRFRVLGDRAAYVKHGLDVQEERLRAGAVADRAGLGRGAATAMGRLVTATRRENRADRARRVRLVLRRAWPRRSATARRRRSIRRRGRRPRDPRRSPLRLLTKMLANDPRIPDTAVVRSVHARHRRRRRTRARPRPDEGRSRRSAARQAGRIDLLRPRQRHGSAPGRSTSDPGTLVRSLSRRPLDRLRSGGRRVQALFTADVSGSSPLRLTPPNMTGIWEYAFSPNGRFIAFAARETCGDFCQPRLGLFLVDRDGGFLRFLADDSYDPSWSPDSHRVASDSPRGIVVTNISGSEHCYRDGLLRSFAHLVTTR